MEADKFASIIAGIEAGEAVRNLCREHNVSSATFYAYLRDCPEAEKRYARAKEFQAEALADEMLEIADDARNDWIEKNDPENPGYVLNGEHVQRSRVRIDTRKWLLSKLVPKKYGDRVALTGAENAPPIKVEAGETVAKLANIIDRLAARGASEG